MKKKTTLSEEDQALFRQLMAGTRKIKQDTIVHRPQRKKISEVPVKRLIQEQADASHYFSDEFQPLLNTEGPVKYVRPDVSHFEAKKLRRGDYSPELFLDLHGLTQLQAKQELGALIAACRREHVFCACVMHGHGIVALALNSAAAKVVPLCFTGTASSAGMPEEKLNGNHEPDVKSSIE